MVLITVLPFIAFLFFLLWKKTSLLTASLASLAITTATTLFIWKMPIYFLLASTSKGFFIAFDIFLIILGAVFFLDILKKAEVIKAISTYLESFSRDFRVQVILLAWFFENFIEGTAGFGTPAAIVAPILVVLGMTPINAIIISLLGNSSSVVFGAAGTPIRVGFVDLNVAAVPINAALFNCVGLLVPVFMLWILTSKEPDRKIKFRQGLPFAIWSGIIFVVPSVFFTAIGQEFPSILGAVAGIILVYISSKLNLFMPKIIWDKVNTSAPKVSLPPVKVAGPYIILVFLLIAGKLILGSGSITFDFFGSQKINLFNPGIMFLLSAIPVLIFQVRNKKIFWSSAKDSFKRTIEPFLVILTVSTMVQLMLGSGSLLLISRGFENVLLPITSPLIGAFGSFLTGSATISNLMFGKLVATAAQNLNFDVAKILALELVGAAAGNMIALADILTAETVVGLKHHEREVLRGVITPCLIYVLIVGIIGLLTV